MKMHTFFKIKFTLHALKGIIPMLLCILSQNSSAQSHFDFIEPTYTDNTTMNINIESDFPPKHISHYLDEPDYTSVKFLNVKYQIKDSELSLIQEFTNVEKVVLSNCWGLNSLPMTPFKKLPNLTILELHKASIYHNSYFSSEGFREDEILNLLNLPKLKKFTLTLPKDHFDLITPTKIIEKGASKGIHVTIYSRGN